jgi:hypothetical protein
MGSPSVRDGHSFGRRWRLLRKEMATPSIGDGISVGRSWHLLPYEMRSASEGVAISTQQSRRCRGGRPRPPLNESMSTITSNMPLRSHGRSRRGMLRVEHSGVRASSHRRNDLNRSRCDALDPVPQLGDEPPEMTKPRIERLDHDDPDRELRDILLVAHSLIRGHQDIETLRRLTKKVPVLQSCPTFFLNGPNLEIGQISPKASRHVLVKENPSHAI